MRTVLFSEWRLSVSLISTVWRMPV
uniref:Uncharacterized protein n=1 Tax=Anguilla anguilla TaxID=7936 RepID=A0A0E9UTH3_ANGAN